ncbi:MAG: response regulator [Thermodesulfobacteriota bacterium]
MKHVLIVDDDAVTRGLLSRVLKPHSDYFEVMTSKDGKDAVAVIQQTKIDLVITDLQMPEMDGFALMAYINEYYPEIPVFVMTAFGGSEIKSKAESVGSIKYFEKPLNIDIITECILEELSAGAEGRIQGISLASFLQLIEMENKTCTLTVKMQNKAGALYFVKGEMMSAEMGDLKNEAAAFELLCWERVTIHIDNICKKKTKEIEQPLMNLLMEGLRLKDERDHASKKKKAPLKPLKRLHQAE